MKLDALQQCLFDFLLICGHFLSGAAIKDRNIFRTEAPGRARRVYGSIAATDYDDGVVAWVNGTEVYHSGEIADGSPVWNTPSLSHESSNGLVPD